MQPLLNIATRAARRAGDLIVRSMSRLDSLKIDSKGRNDFVTDIDRQSEADIIATIRRAHPDHAFHGEESGRSGESEYVWIIDPLDGTTNFLHGFPTFAVSIAVEHRGRLQHSVIYDPMRDELFTAERGHGARLNGKPIHVARIDTLAESLVSTGFPSRKRHDSPNIHFYHEFTLRSHGVRRAGSAALDLAYVASGRLEAFWEFNLNPWDTAAGILLVEEAGGAITDFAGGAFQLNSREVLASNGRIHAEMVSLFKDMFAGRDLAAIPTPREFAQKRAEKNK